MLLRGFRERAYFRGLGERFGFLPRSLRWTAHGSVWLHAVSVGEVMSSVRLLERLRAEYPSRRLFVSSTTLAGRALAEEKLRGLADGIFYAPIDYCFAVRRLLRVLRPSVAVILETEIWPNWYREIKRAGAGLLISNGRISDKAMPRYRAQRWFFRHALSLPDAVLAQSDVAARRFIELGAPPARVHNAGNLKYDFDPAKAAVPEPVQRLIDRTGPSAVWIAASTMPPVRAGDVDEDEVVLEAFRTLAAEHRRLLLILVPRRPARFDEAAARLQRAGVPFLRRSQLGDADELPLPGVLLLDTIGELGGLFPVADVVFMGGTLAERGGHNVLEPAFFGRPIVSGPHLENFPAIAEEFRRGGALVEISRPGELARAVGELLRNPDKRRMLGERARQLAEAQRGATERVLAEIRRLSAWSIPAPVRPLPLRILLWPLARLWEAGSRWKRERAMARRRWLDTPVVSIGGIGMGGAGKTPFVLFLAEKLQEAGRRPAILTRGYRRRVPEKATILPAGAKAPVTLTGDEAQLLLQAGVAPVGIGANRYHVGTLLEKQFAPEVILLDDGFQHWQLGRQFDLVLIDALDPFAGGELFPLGRLREPLAALARADAFLVTRAEAGSPREAIAARLGEWNPRAPVFFSRVAPLGWVDAATGRQEAPAAVSGSRVAAFCGLANPASFWRTLASLNARPIGCWAFRDHHHYRPREIQRLAAQARAAGAEALVTTEKDLVNLPPRTAELVGPLRLLWLRIGIVVEKEEVLLRLIQQRLERRGVPRRRTASL